VLEPPPPRRGVKERPLNILIPHAPENGFTGLKPICAPIPFFCRALESGCIMGPAGCAPP